MTTLRGQPVATDCDMRGSLPLADNAGEIGGRASRSNADITHDGEGRWP